MYIGLSCSFVVFLYVFGVAVGFGMVHCMCVLGCENRHDSLVWVRVSSGVSSYDLKSAIVCVLPKAVFYIGDGVNFFDDVKERSGPIYDAQVKCCS